MGERHILVVVPTYNEKENIGNLVEALFSLPMELSLLVVDDNSPDGTADIVRSMQQEYKRLHLVVRPKKLGLGSAYRQGFTYAVEKGYGAIIQMDADFSHSPGDLLRMVPCLDECDCVVGSRYVRGGGIRDWGEYRMLLSSCANGFTRRILRLPVRDCTSGFKCFKSTVISRAGLLKISSRGYSFQIESIYRIAAAGLSIKEVPIVFQGRKYERSKMSWNIVCEAFLRVFLLAKESMSRKH